MKCLSCETEINPKWRHAIEQNICPYCGKEILEQLLKELLSTLQDTMEKLQAYPDQLNDWLLSNYNYIKTDNSNLINYVPKEALKEVKKELDNEEFYGKKKVIKVKDDKGEQEVIVQKMASDAKTASFFERAELIKKGAGEDDGDLDTDDQIESEPQSVTASKSKSFKSAAERTEHFKKLKRQIEREAKGQSGVVSKEGLAVMIDPDMEADPADIARYGSMISGGDIISSGISASVNLDDEDAATNRVLSMNLAVASRNKDLKGQDGGYNEKDAKALQLQVEKAKGNSGGGFSRSS